MAKVFMGARLQRLREERHLSQVALAKSLGISASYLNQIERNQRPLTVPILLRVSSVLGVDAQRFSEHDSAGLVADLRDVLGEQRDGDAVSLAELRMLADNMPAVARSVLRLHRRYRASSERADLLAARLGDEGRGEGVWAPSADDEVREYLNRRQNHVAELDEAAEQMHAALQPNLYAGLLARLAERHGIRVVASDELDGVERKRRFDERARVLWLADALSVGQRVFQMGAQLALLEQGGAIDALVEAGGFGSDAARAGARLALSNYFAGALLMPYRGFLEAAEAMAYDIERLAHRFGAGFEAVCHRLSTLQRPGAPGLPFFFMRVDRAGNVSKRQSATDFHFSRIGGTCPLWIVYEAFSHPTQVLTQVARMPDGRTYLWIARQVHSGPAGYRAPGKTFAVALGCDIAQAQRLVYSKGLELRDPAAAAAIGTGCKTCERGDCPQRAFPSMLSPATP
jgi:predicted transcriptional regulator/transcriptional regulator with XRE-family HTH domain